MIGSRTRARTAGSASRLAGGTRRRTDEQHYSTRGGNRPPNSAQAGANARIQRRPNLFGESLEIELIRGGRMAAEAHEEAIGPHFDVAAQLLDDGVDGAAERTSIVCLEIHRRVEAHVQRRRVATRSLGLASNAGDAPGHFLRREVGRRSPAARQPPIAELCRAAQSRAAMAANPDGRVGLLDRMRMRSDRLELIETALEAGDVLCPDSLEDVQLLVANAATVLVHLRRKSQRFELLAHPANADSEVDAAARQIVKRSDHLGGEQGMAVRQDQHGGAQSDATR